MRRPRDAVVIALVVVIPIVAAVLVVQAVIARFGAWSVSDVLGWSVLLDFIAVGFLVVRSGGGLRGAVLAAIVVAEFLSLLAAAFIATGVFPARTKITPRLQWTTVVYGALGQAIFSVPLGFLGGLLYRLPGGPREGRQVRYCDSRRMTVDPKQQKDPFVHLKQRAAERADRTVERVRAAIVALRAANRKITAESLKQVSRELEPGFAGLSFQVIRRNPRAYALYRESADAFTASTTPDDQRRKRRRARRASPRTPRASYDPLQRIDKRDLVRRIRALEQELEKEQQRRGALAYDQQALRAKLLRLETEIILLHAERSLPE